MNPTFLFVVMLTGITVSTAAQFPSFPKGPPFGMACGIVGTDPEPRRALEVLIDNKDTVGIFSWLHDTSAVYQAYGAEGIRLRRSGMLIPRHELDLVDELLRSKRMVYVCSGCSHWFEEMRVALSDSVSMNNIR